MNVSGVGLGNKKIDKGKRQPVKESLLTDLRLPLPYNHSGEQMIFLIGSCKG